MKETHLKKPQIYTPMQRNQQETESNFIHSLQTTNLIVVSLMDTHIFSLIWLVIDQGLNAFSNGLMKWFDN